MTYKTTILATLLLCTWLTAVLAVTNPTNAAAPSSLSLPTRQELPGVFRRSAPTSVEDLKAMERHVEALAKRIAPAVVAVRVGNGAGSAVVVSPDGLVLCAAHVCGQPDQQVEFVFPDGHKAHGKTLGTDHETDAGLMKITDTGPWPWVDLADPISYRSGDWVLALGHPGGYDPDRSLVTRLGRVIQAAEMIQTDCTLMAGDSGGPLFDMSGRVIGIHSRISDSFADNYHVPIGAFRQDWARLLKGEKWGQQETPVVATIGVRGTDDPAGCRLEQVLSDGPGSRAGLLAGDLVLRVAGEPVADASTLVQCVRKAHPGDEIAVVVKRGEDEKTFKVKVEGRPAAWGRRQGPPRN